MRKNEKRLIGLAILLFVATSGMASASGYINEVKVGYYTLTSDTIKAYITVIGADNVGGLTVNLGYDPKVLEAQTVDKGSLVTGSTNFTYEIDKEIGNITVVVDPPDMQFFAGDGAIAYVTFKVIGAQGDSSPLDVSVMQAETPQNDDISGMNQTDSTYVVGGTATPTSMETPSVTETTTETATETTTETATETATETTLPPPTVTPKSPGFALVSSIIAIALVLLKRKINKK